MVVAFRRLKERVGDALPDGGGVGEVHARPLDLVEASCRYGVGVCVCPVRGMEAENMALDVAVVVAVEVPVAVVRHVDGSRSVCLSAHGDREFIVLREAVLRRCCDCPRKSLLPGRRRQVEHDLGCLNRTDGPDLVRPTDVTAVQVMRWQVGGHIVTLAIEFKLGESNPVCHAAASRSRIRHLLSLKVFLGRVETEDNVGPIEHKIHQCRTKG
mmetsp:Transcript_57556/g.135449  ORF Transcript_57556/g.135449 Transcript_57556/m.135449 type:complete len:213 (-) Transcript_57556:81-719(-)